MKSCLGKQEKIKKIILGISVLIILILGIFLWWALEDAKQIAQTSNMYNLGFQIKAYKKQNGKMPKDIAALKLDTSPNSLLDNIDINNIEYLGNVNDPNKYDDIMFQDKQPRRYGLRKGRFVVIMNGHVIFKEE